MTRGRLRATALAGLGIWLGAVLRVQAGVDPVDAELRPLGRLFHTPAERAQLDEQPGRTGPVSPRRAAPGPRPRAPDQARSLRGFVLRSDGQDSFWLDRGPLPAEPGTIRR